MKMPVEKDPGADLDYGIDWSAWLGADTISTSSWSVPAGSGLVAHDPAIDSTATKTVVWLRAGTVKSTAYLVTNTIVTAGGRTDKRSIQILVVNR